MYNNDPNYNNMNGTPNMGGNPQPMQPGMPQQGMQPQQPMMQQPMMQQPTMSQPGVNPQYNGNMQPTGMAPNYNMGVASTPAKKPNTGLIVGIVVAVIAVIVIVLVFVLGGGKSLTCTQEQSLEGTYKLNQTINLSFDKAGKKLKTAKLEVKMEVESAELLEYAAPNAEDECKDFEDINGVGCKVSKEDKTITETITIDLDKISKEDAEKLGLDITDTAQTIDDAKKYYTDEGYTCK